MPTWSARRATIPLAVALPLMLIMVFNRIEAAHSTSSYPTAVATVHQDLARRGVTATSISCARDSADPATLPAVAQIASLHPTQTPSLYGCDASNSGATYWFCVVGFNGQAPWTAIETTPPQQGCASLGPQTP
jgi:hypothetical protein